MYVMNDRVYMCVGCVCVCVWWGGGAYLDCGDVDPLVFVNVCLERKDMFVEQHLQFLIAEIDAQLLERVAFKDLKPEDIEHAEQRPAGHARAANTDTLGYFAHAVRVDGRCAGFVAVTPTRLGHGDG